MSIIQVSSKISRFKIVQKKAMTFTGNRSKSSIGISPFKGKKIVFRITIQRYDFFLDYQIFRNLF